MTARHQSPERAFRHLLGNSFVTGTTGMFAWFALSFWVYLDTRSVVATAVIGGAYAVAMAGLGMAFGTYVDHHRKHQALALGTAVAVASFTLAWALYLLVPGDDLLEMRSPWFWLLVTTVMAGAVAGGLRSVVLPTCVTLMVPEEGRAKANGAVGTINGISFTATSVLSGLVVGQLGMGWALGIAVVASAASFVHLWTFTITEDEPKPAAEGASRIDVAGALAAIRVVPGLALLVGFAAYNNLLGGVFMALLDPYGLELVSVEAWGVLFAVVSVGFVAGGAFVAKRGLGRDPLRAVLVGNIVGWTSCLIWPLKSSVILLAAGMLVWMFITPVVEAAEQTVLQNTVPYETQGRVFGFAQTVENLTSPVTSFLIGPLAETFVIPFMEQGGAGADSIGSWFGVGRERGLALVFWVAAIGGVLGTIAVWRSRGYRLLTEASRSHIQVAVDSDHLTT